MRRLDLSVLRYLPAQRAKSAREDRKCGSSISRSGTPASRAAPVMSCCSRHSPGSSRLKPSGCNRCNCAARRPTSVGSSLSSRPMYSTTRPRPRSASRQWRIAAMNSAMRALWLQTQRASPGASIISTRSCDGSSPASAGLSRPSWSPSTSTSWRTGWLMDAAGFAELRRGNAHCRTSRRPSSSPRRVARSSHARTGRRAFAATRPCCP